MPDSHVPMVNDEHTDDESLRISSALKADLCDIESALDRLHRLGVVIRQLSAGQLMSRTKPLVNNNCVDMQEAKGGQAKTSIFSSAFDTRVFRKQFLETRTLETPLPPKTSIRIGSVNYSPPQAINGDAWDAKCEWCLEDHPASMLKTPLEWRHVEKSHKEVATDEIQTMARHNTVLINRPTGVCPFCCYTIEYDARTENAAADASEIQKTDPDTTVSKHLCDIPKESGDHSSKPIPIRQMNFHVAGLLNTFTMLMIRMLSAPDGGDNIENRESAAFSVSSSIGDNESNYQNWELSSDDEEVSGEMPDTSGNVQYHQSSKNITAFLSEVIS
ncbi:hypothetical protein FHL15_011016 [Xylaria flabelliformis]|uniref:Uncharacterized protein n=1 Tax=Xylaria flabelliformis TaxID=2512241 RepID=A0A553HJD3_9PEZI|nr:hypothetical protein FHL15_011016 [Xylaria flabelliformis]